MTTYTRKTPNPFIHPEYGYLKPVMVKAKNGKYFSRYWLSDSRKLYVGDTPLWVEPAGAVLIPIVRPCCQGKPEMVPFNSFPLEGVEWEIAEDMAKEAVSSLGEI